MQHASIPDGLQLMIPEHVWISGAAGNRMADAGAKALAEAAVENRTLRELDLGRNRIRDAGAEAWAAALHSNSSLQTLKVNEGGPNKACLDAHPAE